MTARRLDYDKMHRLWCQGLRADDIAVKCATTANTVRTAAHTQDWPVRNRDWMTLRHRAVYPLMRSLWDAGMPSDEIATRCGYARGSSVRHVAHRLGWPTRHGCRDTRAACAVVAANRRVRSIREASVHLARLEAALANEAPEPPATFYRCACGGRSDKPTGHPACAETRRSA